MNIDRLRQATREWAGLPPDSDAEAPPQSAQATITAPAPTKATTTAPPPTERRNAVPLGRALETARRRVGYSLSSAANALGLDERELGQYESDIRTPSVETLLSLAGLYGIDPERFGTRPYLPRVPPRIDHASRTLHLGWMTIDLAPADQDPASANRYLLQAIGNSLRAMRSLDRAQPVYLRRSELPLLAELLDVNDDDLPALMMHHLSLTYIESVELSNDLLAAS